MPTDRQLRVFLRRADPARAGEASPLSGHDEFVAEVHQRIRTRHREAGPAIGPRDGRHRPLRPLAAVLAVLAAFLAGGSVAYARHQRWVTDQQADAFARSVDPILMHAEQTRR